jgi:integrase/recombinase XerC/integrase/recombinase XerD
MSAEYLDIKPSLVDFVNHCRNQNLSYSATKTKFTALNNYFTFLMDEGAININPVLQFRSRYVRTYKSPDTRDIIELTTQDIETLLKVANNPLFEAVIILSALTGLRRAELTALNIENIDFENRLIFVNPHPKRTNLRIPFSEDVFYYLDRYLKIRTE